MNLFGWAESNTFRDALRNVADGQVPIQEAAIDLLKTLAKESELYIKHRISGEFYDRYFPTSRHGGAWKAGDPVGVVDHYTAAPTAGGTLRWFSNEPRPEGSGNSSAHYVVDVDGTAIQLVDPLTTVAWHATVANKDHVGIEHVNCGNLTPIGGTNFLYMGQYKYSVNISRPPENVDNAWWEPFSSAQIATNIVLKRLLLAAIPSMKSENFIQHKDVAGANKVDCGPLWPMEDIRKLATSGEVGLVSMPWANVRFADSQILARMHKEVEALFNQPRESDKPVLIAPGRDNPLDIPISKRGF